MSWQRDVRDFERHLRVERNLSPNTQRAYLKDVEQLAEHCGAGSAGDVAPLDVRGWLAMLHRDRSAATVGRKLSGVRAFFRYLLREGRIERDPSAGLPAPKQPARLPRPLSVDDCEVLANAQERAVEQALADEASGDDADPLARDRALRDARSW